jgi:hypothetical protein
LQISVKLLGTQRGADRFHQRVDSVRRIWVDSLGVGGAQPRELPLGELPRRCDRARAQRRAIDLPLQIGPDLSIAHAAHRRHVARKRIAPTQLGKLVDQSLAQHRVEAPRDRLVQTCAIGGNERKAQHRAERVRVRAATLQRRKRRPCEMPDFERTLDSLRVGRRKTGGRFRVDSPELRVQRGPAFALRARIDFRAQVAVSRGQRG